MATEESLTILVIGDAHAKPGVSNERFTWLGRMICDVRPDVVVCIGDLFDLPSLSSYDTGKRSFEGRRYRDDLEAGIDAQRKIFAEVDAYNRPRRGSARLEIEWIYTLGNHEARINRVVEDDAKIEGVISTEDLMCGGEFPWRVVSFNEPTFVGGVGFSHYWASGVMGRSIGGVNPAASIISKQLHSCVQGHTHTLDFAERVRADGSRIRSVVCGCYFDHYEEWAGPQVNSLWSPGILVMRDVKGGEYDFSWTSLSAIRSRYG